MCRENVDAVDAWLEGGQEVMTQPLLCVCDRSVVTCMASSNYSSATFMMLRLQMTALPWA